MLELEENSRRLELIKQKTQSLGESLWHSIFRKTIKRVRIWNCKRRILAEKIQMKQEKF